MSKTDTEFDLEIVNVAHGGVFVGRHEGRVVFVPDAIPGETVRVRVDESAGEAKSFWRAEALEVKDASPHRRSHVWAEADISRAPGERVGGADFGHIELSYQRELKARVLREALERFAHIERDVVVEPAGVENEPESADGTRWRTRVSLHVDADGRIGPFAARSHRVITVGSHPLATAEIERTALDLAGARVGRVDLVQAEDGRVRVLPRPEEQRPARARQRRGARPTSSLRPPEAAGARAAAREIVHESAGARDFRVDAGGFWQVHRLAADTLHAAVGSAIRSTGLEPAIDPDAWNLDLYGGVGLFAATLAEVGGPTTKVTTVESDARATEHAGENLAEWVGARAETERVDRYLARIAGEASARDRERLTRGVVVLDPPRSGAGRDVVEGIVALGPAAVVYVACDPVALARDLATFASAGYEARGIRAFDLFPHSHHLEAIAVLER